MKKGYIFLFVILLLPFNVYALTGSVSINCGSNTVKKGDTVACNVVGTSDTAIYGISTKVNISSGAVLEKFDSVGGVWQMAGVKNDGVTIYGVTKSDGVSGNFDFGTITMTISNDVQPGNITISLSDFDFVIKKENGQTDDAYEGINGNTATLTVIAESSNNNNSSDNSSTNDNSDTKTVEEKTAFFGATLKEDSKLYLTELNIDGYNLNFTKEKLNYLLEIDNEDSLNITPVLNDDSAGSYSIDGNSNLVDGSIISITLKPNDDGEEVKYTITISKQNNYISTTSTTGSSNNKSNLSTIIFGIIIGVLVIINIARILLNKKKKNIEV